MVENDQNPLAMLKAHLSSLQEWGVDSLPLSEETRNLLRNPRPQQEKAAFAPALEERREPLLEEKPASSPPASGQGEMPKEEHPLTLELLRRQLGECERCPLSQKRKTIVFGEGNPKAKLVFVGEGPGHDEDIQGRPFVGKAGQLLTKIIESGMGLKRSEVYICNIVKCRPPGNRDPESKEVEACLPFLEKQLEIIKPQVIVTLGLPATRTLLDRPVKITQERGKWNSWKGVRLMPTFHPAFVLRNYTRTVRGQVFEDMKLVLKELEKGKGGW